MLVQNDVIKSFTFGHGSGNGKPVWRIETAGSGGSRGEVLLDYAVYDAKHAGFERVVFLIRKDLEADFRKAIGKRYEGKIEVDYAFQELHDLPKGFVVPEGRKSRGVRVKRSSQPDR